MEELEQENKMQAGGGLLAQAEQEEPGEPDDGMAEGEETEEQEDAEDSDEPQSTLEYAAKLASNIPKPLQEAFARIVKAGMKFLFSEETHQFMIDALTQEDGRSIAEHAGEAMTGLMLLLFKKSNGTMPQELLIPAGIYLMLHAVDFLEQATGEEFTPEVIADSIESFIMQVAKQTGVAPDKLRAATEKLAAGGE